MICNLFFRYHLVDGTHSTAMTWNSPGNILGGGIQGLLKSTDKKKFHLVNIAATGIA
jgi:hypothetical protein